MKNPALSKQALCMALVYFVLSGFFAAAFAQTSLSDQETVQQQIEAAKIYRDTYPLITETDLYGSIFVYEGKLPELRIIEAERSDQKTYLTEDDIVFINKGKADGIEMGQVFQILEVGNKIGNLGYVAIKQGRVNVICLEDNRAVARVEKTFGRVMLGNYLVPFEEKEGILGKDLGYEAFCAPGSGPIGHIIFVDRDYIQIGSGAWAIIDIGEDSGIQVGQQMTVFRAKREDLPVQVYKTKTGDLPVQGIGNVVVIDTGAKTATIKVLSCSDSIRKGQWVQGFLMSEKAEPEEVAPAPPAAEEQPAAEQPPAVEKAQEPAEKSLEQLNQEQPLQMIHFDFDKSFIRDDAKPILESNAAWLKKFETVKVRIEGHADERGTEAYNLALGQRRAKSTLDYMFSLGIPQERMEIISYGEGRPLDPGHNEAAWAKNRRAEFVIIAK
jgi:peptidoglycan-associated lipoprotein